MTKLENLEGKWYIVFTNFPMWLKGDKTQPSFNYRIETRGGKTGLKDEVTYLKKGKIRSIVGFDFPKDSTNVHFIWRGNGILGLLSSSWSIDFLSPTNDWAIISFEKTMFTPAGYDVITREQRPSPELLEKIHLELNKRSLVLTSLFR